MRRVTTSTMNKQMDSTGESPERDYPNPPVVEALGEVIFASTNWDDTVPDQLFEGLKDEFPKRQERTFNEARVTVDDNNEATAEVVQLPTWDVFLTESEDQLIQVSEKHISFNQLKPYRPFREWEGRFFEALSMYRGLTFPQTIERMGIRYINRIEIPGQRISMEDYFSIYPVLPEETSDFHGPFQVKCQIPLTADDHFLVMVFGSIQPDEADDDRQNFLLDLHVQVLIGKDLDDEDIKNHIRIAHRNAVRAFEGSITEKLRALFSTGETRNE